MASTPPPSAFRTDEEKGPNASTQDFSASSSSSSTEHVPGYSSVDDEKRQPDGHIVLTQELSKQTTESVKVTPPAGAFNPQDNPDGGSKAWLCVLGSFCIMFCSFGWVNCIGVFQAYYQTHLLAGYSSSTVSWIPSLQLFFMFFFGPVIGTLYDR